MRAEDHALILGPGEDWWKELSFGQRTALHHNITTQVRVLSSGHHQRFELSGSQNAICHSIIHTLQDHILYHPQPRSFRALAWALGNQASVTTLPWLIGEEDRARDQQIRPLSFIVTKRRRVS